ncbi:protoglobin domain-containing protein [Thalassoroseus pseudoceratinae]|uniref:protoglobin domain-containing protein n=1 Tax=Thalassoroseus pseudoceratinae TaxID=2713176 RepID=UPI00141F3E49|nr:protoglobin domain-containing protein [Thalassoroseus pseudoceratinae]
MNHDTLFQRYQSLQAYVGWSEADRARIASVADDLRQDLDLLVDDFYQEVEKHPAARRVITGDVAQIARLKRSLTQWLLELLAGVYDAQYVARRWQVGYRHVEIGLDQIYTNVALSRLRSGLHERIENLVAQGCLSAKESHAVSKSLSKLLDLDLAIIEEAYQAECVRRQQQVEKLATIGQVAGGVAHELRNPLNVIKTSIYYLLHARNATEEKRLEHLNRIDKQVSIANGVISALSSFAKLPVPSLESVALDHWIPTVLETIEIPESIEVTVDFTSPIPAVWMDPKQMPIVLRNLIQNACDAMPDGGPLHIRTTTNAGQVCLEVIDKGLGISNEDLPRIMEPLFTTKARGIGLGLAISKAIVEKNNAELHAASQPGSGTTMIVRFPVARPTETREDSH